MWLFGIVPDVFPIGSHVPDSTAIWPAAHVGFFRNMQGCMGMCRPIWGMRKKLETA